MREFVHIEMPVFPAGMKLNMIFAGRSALIEDDRAAVRMRDGDGNGKVRRQSRQKLVGDRIEKRLDRFPVGIATAVTTHINPESHFLALETRPRRQCSRLVGMDK